MKERLAEPDYQLTWPRTLFVAEAARLLNHRELRDWDDRCELLLDDAFVGRYDGGPLSEFRELASGPAGDAWSTGGSPGRRAFLTHKQEFLRQLMDSADQLHENPVRRPYWRERRTGTIKSAPLDLQGFARAFVAVVVEFEYAGYFEKRFGKDCVDDPYGEGPSQLIQHELGAEGLWPLDQALLADNQGLLFDLVELLHDLAARPRARWFHSYGECGWHHSEFDIQTGRQVYRWRVNRVLSRSDVGLRLAEEGADIGRLVTVSDDARTELVAAALQREGGETPDQVRHAIQLFRARGADRNDKRSAVAALALVLEERRHGVLPTTLAKGDRGAIFEIANKFHIRHQDLAQKRDYDDFYLDWIFWLYLSTVELTDRVIEQQKTNAG